MMQKYLDFLLLKLKRNNYVDKDYIYEAFDNQDVVMVSVAGKTYLLATENNGPMQIREWLGAKEL